MKAVFRFFDRIEDHTRGALAHYPLTYSIIGGTGVVLFWRGIWHSADYLQAHTTLGSFIFSDLGSVLLGLGILLITGLFVSVFIGDSIIISGMRGSKKIIEKTESEIELEAISEKKLLASIAEEIRYIKEKL